MKVRLISYTPDPAGVASRAARVCVSQDIPDAAYPASLRAALKSGHESVLEHVSFTFSAEGISRACSHQLVRHRIASYSQQSQRYVKLDNAGFVIPESFKNWDMVDYYDDDGYGSPVKINVSQLIGKISDAYRDMIEKGIPAEDARYILPNATCTNIILTMNARELRHFIKLRTCGRAQWEIRELACKMRALAIEAAPELFEDTGPACISDGRCTEARPCGECVLKVREEMDRLGAKE